MEPFNCGSGSPTLILISFFPIKVKEEESMEAEAEISEEQMDTILKRPAFPPLKKEKAKDGTEVIVC